VALGAILCVLVLAFGRNSLVRDGLVSADEGAVLSQMEVRRTTGDWGMRNPLPAVDPDARWFGISGSDLDADRAYPYAKHVAYPAVAQPFFDLGGARLVVGLSALGSLVTAALAALLARRVRRDLDVPTLWVVGIVSPIFFDSFWAIAHSMGAAFATGAVLAAVVAIERRQARWIPLAALAVAAAALLRSEGMLFGVALGGGLLALAGMRRDRLAAAAGVAAGAAASVAWWIDGRLHTAVVGATHPPFRISTTADQTWLSARWDGAWASLLRPQLQATTTAGTIFLGVALAGALAALYVRAKPTEVRLIRGLAGIAGVAAIAALAFRVAPVPGLLVAFPILPIGLIVATRSTFESVTAHIVGVTALLFSGTVVATQYAVGGSMEWGGRFFHLAIPALVPVVLMSLDGARSRLDPTTRRDHRCRDRGGVGGAGRVRRGVGGAAPIPERRPRPSRPRPCRRSRRRHELRITRPVHVEGRRARSLPECSRVRRSRDRRGAPRRRGHRRVRLRSAVPAGDRPGPTRGLRAGGRPHPHGGRVGVVGDAAEHRIASTG
jgi:hypothetical protein